MNRTNWIAAAAAVAAMGFGASPAAAVVTWQAVLVVKATSPECAASGIAVGQRYQSTLRPAGVADNGADSGLTFIGNRTGVHILKPGSLTAGTAHTETVIGGRGLALTTASTSVVTMSPAVPLATTPNVRLSITIDNWIATAGCTATLEGGYIKRP